jgi:hypothetical protein
MRCLLERVRACDFRTQLAVALIASRLRMNPEFAAKVSDMIAPGTTVIITISRLCAAAATRPSSKAEGGTHRAAVEMIAEPTPANCNS